MQAIDYAQCKVRSEPQSLDKDRAQINVFPSMMTKKYPRVFLTLMLSFQKTNPTTHISTVPIKNNAHTHLHGQNRAGRCTRDHHPNNA